MHAQASEDLALAADKKRAASEGAPFDLSDIAKRREKVEQLRKKAAEARDRAGLDRDKWLSEVQKLMADLKTKEKNKDEL